MPDALLVLAALAAVLVGGAVLLVLWLATATAHLWWTDRPQTHEGVTADGHR